MKPQLILGQLCIAFLLTSCKGPDDILLIGLDESGNEVEFNLDRTIYQNELTKYVQQMDLATVNALESNMESTWSLSKVELGLSLTASLNLGPIWKASFSAGQRIIYTKNESRL